MSNFFLKPPASGATTGGLFGSAPSQPAGGLFGNTGAQQQNQQGGGIFGNTGGQQQNQQGGGLFGKTAGQQQTQQSGGLFGSTGGQQQTQQSTGLFGNTGGLFNNPSQQQSTSLFPSLSSNQASNQPSNILNLKNANQDPNPTSNLASNKAQIDISHIRPTTKFDHLTPSLQSEIEAVETHILGEISKCAELSAALPSIIKSGEEVPESYKFVREKFDELSLALENDAADIVLLRDKIVRRDVAEGRLCWKSVDRLKMPSQYQSQHHHGPGGMETVYGGSGLSGWWNNPTMFTRTRHGTQRNVVSVEDDAEVEVAGGTLVDLLNSRVEEMGEMLRERKELLGEIEGFVGNVEGKILMREREMVEGGPPEGEREHQMKMLRYVFGEVERSLYEVADRVGESRDGLMELGERSVRARMAF